ncbi:dihydroxyacetone kinase subunit L, partial [bacterium]
METFKNADGKVIVLDMIGAIHANAAYLSEVDGAIGDGDHGINMDKGFSKTRERLGERALSLSDSLSELSSELMEGIGGSMGPLYGTFFMEMADASETHAEIDRALFGDMLARAVSGIQEIGSAQRGDKTLLDTLIPAEEAYRAALAEGKSFAEALQAMRAAAEAGKDATRDMVARIGRASRLGERSRGVLDAGATSCYLLLNAMA